jgi:hypothetical protein
VSALPDDTTLEKMFIEFLCERLTPKEL